MEIFDSRCRRREKVEFQPPRLPKEGRKTSSTGWLQGKSLQKQHSITKIIVNFTGMCYEINVTITHLGVGLVSLLNEKTHMTCIL